MKKALLLIFVLAAGYCSAKDDSLAIIPLSYNFKGVIVSGSNIIAYSDLEYYFLTTDRGLNWKERSVGEAGSIMLMKNYKGVLWGIMDKGIILKSYDDGLSWDKYKYQLADDDRFVYFAVNDDYFYARCERKIVQFDLELKEIRTYSDTSLYSNEKNRRGNETFKYMGIVDGTLLISVSKLIYNGNGDILILDSEDLEQLDKVVLSQQNLLPLNRYVYNGGLELTDIITYKGKTVYMINPLPYYANEDYSEWRYFYSNLDIGNYDMTKNDSIRTSLLSYFSNNDELYVGAFTKNLAFPEIKRNVGATALYSHGIKKYDSFMDSLVTVGNFFENSYYTMGFPVAYGDGISSSISGRKFVILEDSIIVLAGNGKALIQSRDMAGSWKLVSYNSYGDNYGKPKLIVNDSIFYLVSWFNEIYRTTNGGTSFLPVQIDTNEYQPYFQEYSSSKSLHIDEKGKGFFTMSKMLNRSRYNFALTLDSGRTFQFLSKYISPPYKNSSYSNVVSDGDKAVYAANYTDSARLYHVDMNTFDVSTIFSDSNLVIKHIIADNLADFSMFVQVTSGGEQELKTLQIWQTPDSGRTWKTIYSMNENLEVLQVYPHNKDSVFITSVNPDRIFLYKTGNNSIDTIYKDDINTNRYLQLICLSDKFFIAGDSLLLENTDRSDLSKWEPADWDYGTPKFISVIFKGDFAIAEFSDSLRPLSSYKLTLKRVLPSAVEESITESDIAHFYAAPPRPTPASNSVSVKIYWDSQYDIVNANMGVYDILGNRIGVRDELIATNIQHHSAELVWNCSSRQSGVYLIVVDYNGSRRAIRVLVGR